MRTIKKIILLVLIIGLIVGGLTAYETYNSAKLAYDNAMQTEIGNSGVTVREMLDILSDNNIEVKTTQVTNELFEFTLDGTYFSQDLDVVIQLMFEENGESNFNLDRAYLGDHEINSFTELIFILTTGK